MRKSLSCLRRTAGALFLALALLVPAVPAYAAGWIKESGVSRFQLDDGSMLRDRMTPDGYFVDSDGVWKQEGQVILDQRIQSPMRFIHGYEQNFAGCLDMLNTFNSRIQSVANGQRIFHLYRDGITYSALADNKETPILNLTADSQTGGYRLRISGNIGSGAFIARNIHSYDYEVFRYLCTLVSNRPSYLIDAIYQSWQAENHYGINMTNWVAAGDCAILLEVENGVGIYRIAPRPAGT